MEDRAPSRSEDQSLFHGMLPYVRHSLSRLGVPEADRDDLAQEVLIAAYKRRHDYDPSRSPLSWWLGGFVRNIARNYRRSKRTIMIPLAELTPEPVDQNPGPEERTMTKAYQRLLHEVLLPQVRFDARVVVIAHDLDRIDFKTIAAQENIPLQTAYARYKSGLKQLHAAYDRYLNDQKAQGLLVMPFTLEQMLDADRTIPALPPEVVSQTWSQVERALARQAPRNARRALPQSSVLFLVPAFLTGAAVGAVLCSLFRSPTRPTILVNPEPTPPTSVGLLSPSAPITLPPTAIALPAHPVSSGAARHDFRDAQRDFEAAYQAFDRGDYDVALAALAAHERNFPTGAFASERRILRAQIAELRAAGGPAGKADPATTTKL